MPYSKAIQETKIANALDYEPRNNAAACQLTT